MCELLFNHADLKTQEFFFEGSNPPVTLIRALYNFLRFESDPTTHELHITVDAMAERMGKEVNPMAVGTALSCLIHAGAIQRFDVPGQLTKGTRLLKPELNFECLDIDRAALEEKARRDHLKIESMTRFAYSMGCRQQWILDYFGETGAEPCGHCDVCAASGSNEREEVSGDDLLTVRKALAGVARASKRGAEGEWVAIYGRGKIMDMLRGARNASMHQYLTSLSTYGILKNLTDAKMKALFRAMHEAGLLQSTGGDMPLITLTPQGEEVMQSRAVPRLSLRTWSSAGRRPAPAVKRDKTQQLLQSMGLGRLDKELYEHLAELRRDLAAEFNMPAYRIMHNDTLRAMATVKPTTMEAAERLKGVGPWLRTHGLRAFVELIQDYEEC